MISHDKLADVIKMAIFEASYSNMQIKSMHAHVTQAVEKFYLKDAPQRILVENADGEFISATLDKTRTDGLGVPVYEQKEYYHTLESALREVGFGGRL